jgi:hypothetical protein
MDIQDMTDEELKQYYSSEYTNYVVMDNSQQAKKILLNSFFGAFGNASFRYYSLDHAKSITLSGQLGIRYVSKNTNKWLGEKLDPTVDYVAYGDTDSIYLSLNALFKKANLDPSNPEHYAKARELLTRFTDGALQSQINAISDEWAKLMNCQDNLLVMEREAISVRGGIFVAKKKYALLVDDLEGVSYTQEKPYLKAMGLEMSKSGKFSEKIRGWLEQTLYSILNTNPASTQALIESFKKEFMAQNPSEIAFLTNVNDYAKWVDEHNRLKSGTPIGVKALHNHNAYLDMISDTEVDRLQAGDKIYYLPLRKNNPAGVDVIGFIEWTGGLTRLDDHIDRLALWEKNFIGPAQIMLDSVKWTAVKKNSLF